AIFPDPIAFRPTVIAQQALSLLFQNPRGFVTVDALRSRLPRSVQASWSLDDCREILEALATGGYIREVANHRFVADENGLAAYERGRLHSLISDSPEVEVVDETTGRVVGSVRLTRRDEEQLSSGSGGFSLGGQKRKVRRIEREPTFGRKSSDRVRQIVASADFGIEEAQFIAREAPRYSRALAAD